MNWGSDEHQCQASAAISGNHRGRTGNIGRIEQRLGGSTDRGMNGLGSEREREREKRERERVECREGEKE